MTTVMLPRPAADVLDVASRALADASRAVEAAARALAEPAAPATPPLPELLTTAQASELTSVPENTLRYWRSLGEGKRKGPRSFALEGGSVRYRRTDVEAWLQAQYEAEATS